MAHVVQTEVAKFQWLPLATTPHGRKRAPGEPFGWGVHTEDALAIDDIGAGDTGGFILQLPLRQNYAYRLMQASVTVRDEDGGLSLWARPGLRMYWQPKPGVDPAVTTELTYPMGMSALVSAELLESYFMSLGSGRASNSETPNINSTQPNTPAEIPFFYGYVAGTGIDSEFMMTNPNASQTNYQISYIFRWLAFTIEDALTTAMFRPNPIMHV